MTTCDFCKKHIDTGNPSYSMCITFEIFRPRAEPSDMDTLDSKEFLWACQDCADGLLHDYLLKPGIKVCGNCRYCHTVYLDSGIPIQKCAIEDREGTHLPTLGRRGCDHWEVKVHGRGAESD